MTVFQLNANSRGSWKATTGIRLATLIPASHFPIPMGELSTCSQIRGFASTEPCPTTPAVIVVPIQRVLFSRGTQWGIAQKTDGERGG